MNKVWLVCLIDEDHEICGTAQKAYEIVQDYIKQHYDADDGVDRMLEKLAVDYMKYPENFWIEDVGGATAYDVL